MTDPRRRIPSIDAILATAAGASLVGTFGRPRVVGAARAVVEATRARIGAGEEVAEVHDPEAYAPLVAEELARADVPSLRRVINATGVVLHTNLGRAPLAPAAVEAMVEAARGYTNLEYDVEAGARGSRYDHCVALLVELTGAEDAVVVNNNAAALLLALNTLARGRTVVVSRGELVEIGGGFRIPEILERSGARLLEVGSTNRTRLEDYREVCAGEDVAAILKVHRSNFRMTGFTEEAPLGALATLARESGVPLVHDLGSGLFLGAERLGLPEEPRASESLDAGAEVVAVSGDKLLGGPQAGILLGSAERIAAMRSNPLCRALRVDKTTLAALEATLRLYRDPERAVEGVPTLGMLSRSAGELSTAAERIVGALAAEGVTAAVGEGAGAVGGGTYPEVELSSAVVTVTPGPEGANALARRLRLGTPPVVARIVDDRLTLDPRTLLPGEEETLVRVVAEAWRAGEADG